MSIKLSYAISFQIQYLTFERNTQQRKVLIQNFSKV